MKLLVLVSLVGLSSAINLIGRTQSAAATGRLTCEGRPASGVEVKLMESDNSFGPSFFDTDDVMAKGKTDRDGRFSLSGTTKEITGIEPYLAIFHDCKDALTPGSRIVRINLPSSYAFSGEKPKKVYDAGSLELAGKFPGEKRSGLFGRK